MDLLHTLIEEKGSIPREDQGGKMGRETKRTLNVFSPGKLSSIQESSGAKKKQAGLVGRRKYSPCDKEGKRKMDLVSQRPNNILPTIQDIKQYQENGPDQ